MLKSLDSRLRGNDKQKCRDAASGRPAEDMEVEYRELVIGRGNSGYVVLYRYDGAIAVILAVRHQKQAGY